MQCASRDEYYQMRMWWPLARGRGREGRGTLWMESVDGRHKLENTVGANVVGTPKKHKLMIVQTADPKARGRQR